jgi:hypothetical protein
MCKTDKQTDRITRNRQSDEKQIDRQTELHKTVRCKTDRYIDRQTCKRQPKEFFIQRTDRYRQNKIMKEHICTAL